MARMDSDDISEINRFELQLDVLKKTDSDICSSNLILINEKKKII